MRTRSASPLQVKKPALGWPAFLFRREEPKHAIFEFSDDRIAIPTLDLPLWEKESPDYTVLLSDELLQRILSLLPRSSTDSASLVSKRWLRILGEIKKSLTLLHWSFLDSSRLISRFPSLYEINLIPASFILPVFSSGMILTSGSVSTPLGLDFDIHEANSRFLCIETVDRGLEILGRSYPNLKKLSMVSVASELGLIKLADQCKALQELELHCCSNLSLRAISAFSNLQILRLVGSIQGIYTGPGVTDVGLTILAHGCTRLVKLELSRCEGGYEGISAIGRCCPMLEELTIHDHKMDAGWMGGLSFCGNLKTLRLQGCKEIDKDPGRSVEELGCCEALERLHLQRCQLRDKKSFGFLLSVGRNAREIIFQHCWGLDDDMFNTASVCRRLKSLSMEGCSKVTTAGLESSILRWPDLERLRIISCNKMKDEDISLQLSSLFPLLKELQWRPDSRSALAQCLSGTRMGKKGSKFFRWN